MTATYASVLQAGLAFAALSALGSVFVRSPYGRFATPRFGPAVPIRLGWLLMEAPFVAFYVVFAAGPRALEPVPLLFAGVWTLHYANRALFFPLAMRARPEGRMALLVVVLGMGVVLTHGWLYATWLGELGSHLTAGWLGDARFLLGLPLYLSGFALIVQSEAILRRLRRERRGYAIPQGGAFRWVSCPHYLGELLAWTGLALATWCPGGLFVLAVSAANLVPRAVATHRWYRREMPGYPTGRRALVPRLF
ncbi:MAG: 3-oxo-5-alpha-steroid 4-dehydrogenase [Myxococcota bacterium]